MFDTLEIKDVKQEIGALVKARYHTQGAERSRYA